MKHLPKLIAAVLVCELVGIASTPFTIAAIPTWYAHITKPPFSPPNWIFGPVWTLLYLMMGVSFYYIWILGWKKKKVKQAAVVFLLQLLLNFLWSFLFFGLHAPLLGLLDIIGMVILIVMTIQKFYPLSKTAAYLLIPYVLWVGFATLLNLSIAVLN